MKSRNLNIALLLIRLAFGFRLIYGVADNIISWEQMLEFKSFLDANHFPLPLVSAITSVYLQAIAGLFWIIGFQTKSAAAVMAINFLVAIIGVHILSGDHYLQTAPALHLLLISILLLTTGPGKYAIDKGALKR